MSFCSGFKIIIRLQEDLRGLESLLVKSKSDKQDQELYKPIELS